MPIRPIVERSVTMIGISDPPRDFPSQPFSKVDVCLFIEIACVRQQSLFKEYDIMTKRVSSKQLHQEILGQW